MSRTLLGLSLVMRLDDSSIAFHVPGSLLAAANRLGAQSLNLKPTPGRSEAIDHLTCNADVDTNADQPRFLTLKTPLWYVPLLELNAKAAHAQTIGELFEQVAYTGNASLPEPLHDIFGPLIRFLLRPKPKVEDEAASFFHRLAHKAAITWPTSHTSNSMSAGGTATRQIPLIGIHIRTQDSTHQTDIASRGAESQGRLEASVLRCAWKRVKAAIAAAVEQCEANDCATSGARVAVAIASDHAGVRRKVLARLRKLDGVVAAGFSASAGGFFSDAASRDSMRGQEVAAIELAILSRANELIQAS